MAGALLASCSGRGDRDAVHVADRENRIRLDLGSGPIEELVLVRDTAGRIVVSGLCFFPDGTRLTVALYDSAGAYLGRTQPVVEQALFRSQPLGRESGGGWPSGRFALDISASFAPGAQPPAVLRAVGSGSAFTGPGMTRTAQGRPAYSRRFQVRM